MARTSLVAIWAAGMLAAPPVLLALGTFQAFAPPGVRSQRQGPASRRPAAPAPTPTARPGGQDSTSKLVGGIELIVGLGLMYLGAQGSLLAHRARVGARGAGTAAAGQPASARPSSVTTTSPADFAMAEQSGVMAPLGVPGESYWDPAGLAKDATLDRFRQLRAAELKHGRVCMMATLGLMVQGTGGRFNFSRPFPPEPSWSLAEAKSGIAALAGPTAAPAYFGLLVLLSGLLELGPWRQEEDKAPGDFGDGLRFGEAWYGGADREPGIARDLENAELANGRLAMVAFLGAVSAEYASGYNVWQQWAHAGEGWARSVAILSGQGFWVGSGYPWGQPL